MMVWKHQIWYNFLTLIFAFLLLLTILLPFAEANSVNPYLLPRHDESSGIFPIVFLLNFPVNTILFLLVFRREFIKVRGAYVFINPRGVSLPRILLTTGIASVFGVFIDLIVNSHGSSLCFALFLIFLSFALLSRYIMGTVRDFDIFVGIVFTIFNAILWPVDVYHRVEHAIPTFMIILYSLMVASLFLFRWEIDIVLKKHRQLYEQQKNAQI
jgi:hypothetical protein